MYSESTSTLWMYSSTSTEYIMPRVHEYRVHLSTPKYVLEYTSTEYMSTSATTLLLTGLSNAWCAELSYRCMHLKDPLESFKKRRGGRRSPAVASWTSDHWVASSNPLRGKFHH